MGWKKYGPRSSGPESKEKKEGRVTADRGSACSLVEFKEVRETRGSRIDGQE